ncbi:hypothetical protein ACWEBX_24300 [Streptomyces sp. NPDC005070]
MKQVPKVLGSSRSFGASGVLGPVREVTGRPHGRGLVRRLGLLDGYGPGRPAALISNRS